jgi:hypothetical protein
VSSTATESPHVAKKLQFDWTITFGNMLSLVAAALAIVTMGTAVDKRLTILEEARLVQRERDVQQDTQLREHIQGVMVILNKIEVRVESIGDKLNARPQR